MFAEDRGLRFKIIFQKVASKRGMSRDKIIIAKACLI